MIYNANVYKCLSYILQNTVANIILLDPSQHDEETDEAEKRSVMRGDHCVDCTPVGLKKIK